MNWDDEVDVVSTGAAAAGLAHAVAAVDMGGEVFVANSRDDTVGTGSVAVRSRVDSLHWLDIDVSDPDTIAYFAALSSDLGPLTRSARDVGVPVRVVEHAEPVGARGAVPPFIGARLRDWAAACLVSPYGYLYSRVSDWQSTTLRTVGGESLEVAEIGSITPDPANVGGSVLEWLTSQAQDRGIDVHPGASLQRLVFEEGDVVGAVFSTSEGPLAVRARHGVTVGGGGPLAAVAAGGPLAAVAAGQSLPGDGTSLRVCLVGQTASRFGRLELLSSEPLDTGGAAGCGAVPRRLHADMHGTHTQLQTWRCRKVDGYPSLGQ